MKQSYGKETYERIEIPPELSDRVEAAIASVRKEELTMKYPEKTSRRWNAPRVCGAAAASLLLCFTLALNTSTAFAAEMSKIPVLGALSRVLTIREITEQDDNVTTELKIPEIQLDSTLSDEVNAQIQKIADAWIDEAKRDFADYKEAYLATGGTEAEWAEREMGAQVDYQIHYETENVLSLELITTKSWVAAAEEHHFYNLDLKEDRELTLEDMLGPDYVEICNSSIAAQIGERMAADENASYFGFGDSAMEGSRFTTVTPETKFYLNEQGNVVVLFGQYEIAPGYMGTQTFVIKK